MARLLRPPFPLNLKNPFLVFLGGTIEMGKSEDWQQHVWEKLKDFDNMDVMNPRRVVFDQADIRNQIKWELIGLGASDVIAMHFEPETMSPVTLLEMGLYAKSGKLIVHCPEGYLRRDNVLITAEEFNIKVVDTLDEMIDGIIFAYKSKLGM